MYDFDYARVRVEIQICEQKTMRIQAGCEHVAQERARVERSLRELRGRLEVLERARKFAADRNDSAHRAMQALTHQYLAGLKVYRVLYD
jgi:hypothetical protein